MVQRSLSGHRAVELLDRRAWTNSRSRWRRPGYADEPEQRGKVGRAWPADRTALDLLDAHLEALRDGADLLLPQDRVRNEAENDGGLIQWALDRLTDMPREADDAFVRQVGGLLTEFRSRRCPWNAAALRLLDDTYTFVATGPRRSENRAHDGRAVMHRSVPDPRGWIRLDRDRDNPARRAVPTQPPGWTPPSCGARRR